MVDAAIAEAKDQLAKITIDYEETTVPHGFDPTDSSSGSVSVPSNGSTTAVVANQPWQAHVTWEKRDALTGGRITEDAEYVFYEWNVDANEYEISSNYRVTRLENGLYTVTVTNPVYTDWTEGYVYYTQDNLGKFRIEEVTAPAGYTDAALQGTDWVEHWSQEFEITASDQTYSYTGDDADYNRPQGNKVIIKKIEAHTGEIIVDDAVFTLYQWNEERGLYEKSKDYVSGTCIFVCRDASVGTKPVGSKFYAGIYTGWFYSVLCVFGLCAALVSPSAAFAFWFCLFIRMASSDGNRGIFQLSGWRVCFFCCGNCICLSLDIYCPCGRIRAGANGVQDHKYLYNACCHCRKYSHSCSFHRTVFR